MAAPADREQSAAPRRGPARDKRVLPHNADAEASILGGILLQNSVLGELDSLEVDDFYLWQHRVVFEAMRNLEIARRPIDVVTVEAEVEKQGKLDAIGGVAFLGELAMRVPTVDNVLGYARIVRDHSMLRKLALTAGRAVERAGEWQYEADELLGETLADLQKLERGYREASEAIPVITVSAALDELERLAATPIFETPFPDLNATLGFGGLLGGQVYYLCGGTGFGKTSWLATVVRAHATSGRPAIVAFWEMFAAYYVARMSAAALGVSANRILRGQVERATIERALPAQHIEFLDSPSMSTLKRLAERNVRTGRGAPLIVVDYVQLLAARLLATMPRPDSRLANEQASAGLRELAKDTGAAVIAVSAAGRAASRKLAADVRKAPARELVDTARESGAIEFDGAGVIVLSVSDEKDADERNIATISVAKARFGETHHIDARYDGKTGEWSEIGRVAMVPKVTPKPDDGALRNAIIEALSKGPLPSKNAIVKAVKKNKIAVNSEVDSMLAEGRLAYENGAYSLPGWSSETGSQTAIPGVSP